MSNFNKIFMLTILAIGMHTAAYTSASKCKKEIEAIVHFTHELWKQESASATKVAQWLEKEVLGRDYCSAQNLIIIDAIISGDYSMDEKILYLCKIKKEHEEKYNTQKQERLWEFKYCAAVFGLFLIAPAIIQPSATIGEVLGEKIARWLNKPATITPRTPSHPDDYTGTTAG